MRDAGPGCPVVVFPGEDVAREEGDALEAVLADGSATGEGAAAVMAPLGASLGTVAVSAGLPEDGSSGPELPGDAGLFVGELESP